MIFEIQALTYSFKACYVNGEINTQNGLERIYRQSFTIWKENAPCQDLNSTALKNGKRF